MHFMIVFWNFLNYALETFPCFGNAFIAAGERIIVRIIGMLRIPIKEKKTLIRGMSILIWKLDFME